jgi:hypothetical protein
VGWRAQVLKVRSEGLNSERRLGAFAAATDPNFAQNASCDHLQGFQGLQRPAALAGVSQERGKFRFSFVSLIG